MEEFNINVDDNMKVIETIQTELLKESNKDANLIVSFISDTTAGVLDVVHEEDNGKIYDIYYELLDNMVTGNISLVAVMMEVVLKRLTINPVMGEVAAKEMALALKNDILEYYKTK